jgi:Zn-dependent peptidase ImmA (M78 family)
MSKRIKLFRIPKYINALDRRFKFKIAKDKDMVHTNKLFGIYSRNLGVTDFTNKKIYINNWLTSGREHTIWHELAHVLFRYYNINDSEDICNAFAKYVINCNKQLGYKQYG